MGTTLVRRDDLGGLGKLDVDNVSDRVGNETAIDDIIRQALETVSEPPTSHNTPVSAPTIEITEVVDLNTFSPGSPQQGCR
jgi:hypothetical protein